MAATTLKDISAALGLSQMTVSRALRGIGRVNPATRDTVRRMARKLGYSGLNHVVIRPGVQRGHGDHVLRVFLPLLDREADLRQNHYSNEILAGLRERLEECGGKLHLVVCSTPEQILEEWKASRSHGLVLRWKLPKAWTDRLRSFGPVLYATSNDCQPGVDAIYTNEHRSAAMVLDYLHSRGHREIAWFGLIDSHTDGELLSEYFSSGTVVDQLTSGIHGPRYAAWANLVYCQVIARQQPFLLLERDWRLQSLNAAVTAGLRQILALKPRPTVIVMPTDAMGCMALQVLKQMGLRVPQDLSLISYGGTLEARHANPALASVILPLRTIGRTIPELLERRLADPEALPVSMQFETSLFRGKSVSDLNAQTGKEV